MKVKILPFLFIAVVALFAACKDDPVDPNNSVEVTTVVPDLWADDVPGGTVEIALLKGICNRRTSAYAECGFFLSTTSINTGNMVSGAAEGVEKCVATGKDDGTFSYKKSDLTLGVEYFFVAYLKLTSGSYKFGEVRRFFPDEIPVVPAAKPTADATVNSFNSATVTVIPGNFGGDAVADKSILKIYELGVYYWEDGNGSLANAEKFYYEASESEIKTINAGDRIPLDLTELLGGKKYNFVPFVRMGIYRVRNAIVALPEVQGDQGNFTTDPAPNAEVTTVGASSITPSRATLSGQVLEDAGDANPEAGFYYAINEATVIQHLAADKVTATSIAADGIFTCVIEGLTSEQTYYYQSYLIVSGQSVVYGDVMEFTTKPVGGDPVFARVDADLDNWAGTYLIVYEGQADYGTGGSSTYQAKTVLVFNSGLSSGSDGKPLDDPGNVFSLKPDKPNSPILVPHATPYLGNATDLAEITGGAVTRTATAATVVGGQIEWTEALDAVAVTIAKVDGGWSIRTASGFYIGVNSSTGNLGASTEFNSATQVHTISISSTDSNVDQNRTFNGCAIMYNNASSGGSAIRVNGNTGRFGYWQSVAASEKFGQHPVALYKLEE